MTTTATAATNRSQIAAHLQDAFHYAAYAAGDDRSTFDDRFIANEARNILPNGREPTQKQLVVVAIERALAYARKAGCPQSFGGELSKRTLAKLRLCGRNLLAAIEAYGASHLIDAYTGRTYQDLLEEPAGYFEPGERELLEKAVRAAEEPDMIDLVAERLEQAEAARKAKFEVAKGTTAKLMAMGVIISCDDAQDNAYRDAHQAEIAKAAGVSPALVAAAAEFAEVADGLVLDWKWVAAQGETQDERAARVSAAITTGGPKNPHCAHNGTKRERGLFDCGRGALGGRRLVCCRCGAEFEVADRRAEPTLAARRAAELYAKFSNENPADL